MAWAFCLPKKEEGVDIEFLISLALVQGITEFLPVSSSGHLVLASQLAGWADQGQTIDIALHVGTLGAVIAYFWKDSLAMTQGGWDLLRGRPTDARRLCLLLVIGTLPVILTGFLLHGLIATHLRSVGVIAAATIGFGILLYIADARGGQTRTVAEMSPRHAAIIGVAQAFALIPGTSRSGITMTAARMLGYDRESAARFSMLLSIPTILAAGGLAAVQVILAGEGETLGWDALLAAGLAFVAAFLTIGGLMAWVRRASLTPFVIYRLLLGGVLLFVLYA